MNEDAEQVSVNDFEVLEDFLEHVDRAHLRNRSNFYEIDFRVLFHFTKEHVRHYLLPIIQEDSQKSNHRGLPVSPVIQLLMALRFYASASYQAVIGDLNEYSQATVCLCIERVSIEFARQLNQYIQFPTTVLGQINNIRLFYKIANVPNVATCIDGTLIKIARCASVFAEVFRSGKGFFSLNIMAAVGPREEFLLIDVRHPGSIHNQTCFDRSALKLFFEENRLTGLILGDNGYGCQPYLLVPVINPTNQMQRNYNQSHKQARNVVERTFGRWKKKFSCLSRGLKNNLDNSIAIICATAVLWNLHINLNYPNNIFEQEIDIQNAAYLDNNPLRNINGIDYRRQFIERHFQ